MCFFFPRYTDTVRDLYPTYIKSNNEQVPTSSPEHRCCNMDRATRDRRNPCSSRTGIRFLLLVLSLFCLLAAQLEKCLVSELWVCCECAVSVLWVCCEWAVSELWVCCEWVVSVLWVCCECAVSELWVCCEWAVSVLWVSCLIMERREKCLLNVIWRFQDSCHSHRMLLFRWYNSEVQVLFVKHCNVIHSLLTLTDSQDLNNAPNVSQYNKI